MLNFNRVIVSLYIFFEVVDVKNAKRPIRLYQDINVEINVAKYLAVEFRRHVDVAVEFFELAILFSKSKNVIPAIEPVVFSADRSYWNCSQHLVFDMFIKLGVQNKQ